jgi:hypothetical protein
MRVHRLGVLGLFFHWHQYTLWQQTRSRLISFIFNTIEHLNPPKPMSLPFQIRDAS